MYNYQIIIEYDGPKFVGWQYQKNGLSIQEVIQKKLTKLLKQKIILVGAGRTDSGVHALGQSANFYFHTKINDYKKFLSSVNFFLKKSFFKRRPIFFSKTLAYALSGPGPIGAGG